MDLVGRAMHRTWDDLGPGTWEETRSQFNVGEKPDFLRHLYRNSMVFYRVMIFYDNLSYYDWKNIYRYHYIYIYNYKYIYMLPLPRPSFSDEKNTKTTYIYIYIYIYIHIISSKKQ